MFIGFGIAFVYKFLTAALQALAGRAVAEPVHGRPAGNKVGLKGAAISGDLSPELLGVGYLIGPRIACLMMAGAVLSFFVLGPLIATFGENLNDARAAGRSRIDEKTGEGQGPDPQHGPGRHLQELPALHRRRGGGGRRHHQHVPGAAAHHQLDRRRPARPARQPAAARPATRRTERDLSMTVVLFGSLAPGRRPGGRAAARPGLERRRASSARCMILLFGFLFVTVSSRLDRRGRLVVEPDLRHDDRHAAADLLDLRAARHAATRRRC